MDPVGVLADVQQSFGMEKDAFNAMGPQVVGFNTCTGSQAGTPTSVVAYYTASDTVTFTFPAAYNWGGFTSQTRTAFSGTQLYHMLGTVETQPGNSWFVADLAVSAAGYGVGTLGFAVHGRADLPAGPADVVFTLSDSTTATVNVPGFGGTNELRRVFVGYDAPEGLLITKVECRRPGGGNSYVALDDLGFIIIPEPATLMLLVGGAVALVRRRR